MIEKFDLTLLMCMGGNMGPADFREAERLKDLVNGDHKNLDIHLEQARFFAGCDDSIHTIISYCYIVKAFNNNLPAYIELAEYLYFANRNEWAVEVAMEGLKHNDSDKLREILNNSIVSFIEMYSNKIRE